MGKRRKPRLGQHLQQLPHEVPHPLHDTGSKDLGDFLGDHAWRRATLEQIEEYANSESGVIIRKRRFLRVSGFSLKFPDLMKAARRLKQWLYELISGWYT